MCATTLPAMPFVLEARNVHKVYRRGSIAVNAVRGVSLGVAAGEMVAIEGPSGSGKSTLLNLLGGLDRVDSGDIIVAGVRLAGLDVDALTRLRGSTIGLVFQFFNLVQLLTARENVALPLLLAGTNRGVADRRAAELLERVGLGGRGDHRPHEMSGGEMQRVAVARALSTRPAVILADEPTGNLDSSSGTAVLGLLRDAARDYGCALCMVTHDPRAAAAADRVIQYKDGKIVSDRRQRAEVIHQAPSERAAGAA
jgi:putative ABC transport system ATP-binding protein